MLTDILEQGNWELAALCLALGLSMALSGRAQTALLAKRDGDDGRS